MFFVNNKYFFKSVKVLNTLNLRIKTYTEWCKNNSKKGKKKNGNKNN